MSSYNRLGYVEKVGKLDLKSYQHWHDIDRDYWATCGLDVHPEEEYGGYYYNRYNRNDNRIPMWSVKNGLVQIQRDLVKAAKCEKNKMILFGRMKFWNDSEGNYVNGRVPYHEDLLPNWSTYYYHSIL